MPRGPPVVRSEYDRLIRAGRVADRGTHLSAAEHGALTTLLTMCQNAPLREIAIAVGRSVSVVRTEYVRLLEAGRVVARPVGRPRPLVSKAPKATGH